MKNSLLIFGILASATMIMSCNNSSTSTGTGPQPSSSETSTLKVSINDGPENVYGEAHAQILQSIKNEAGGIYLFADGPSGVHNAISLDINNKDTSSTSSMVGTYIISKGEPNPLFGGYVIKQSSEKKTASLSLSETGNESGDQIHITYNCGEMAEGTVTLTEVVITSKNGDIKNSYIGYISGNFSLKTCDGKGNSKKLKGTFTKVYASFTKS